jgi:hypothetical protein
MTEDKRDERNIPESLADEPTRQKLAKARKRTRASLVRKLKVSMETVRRLEKRTDLYLSILRHYVERKGGNFCLKVAFPGQPEVILAGLGGDDRRKKAKKKAGGGAKTKPKARPAV